MVAETVKYPPIYQAVAGLSGAGSQYLHSSSMLHPNFSSAHIMDQKTLSSAQHQHQNQQQQQQQVRHSQHGSIGSPLHSSQENTPVSLGAPDLQLSSTIELAAKLYKKDMFTQRKQREFIPQSKKDESYWARRHRNNEAAKRSREKKRFNDLTLEQRVMELSKENHIMKAQLNTIKEKYGILGENLINMDQVMASMPKTEEIIALNKRTKFNSNIMTLGSNPSVDSLLCPEGSGSSLTPTPSMPNSNNDDADSLQNFSQYESAHDEHDNHFESADQYPASSSSDLYYRTSALNLSTHSSSHSPLSSTTSQAEFPSASDTEIYRSSPVGDVGSSLPHKLRHKCRLGDNDAAQSLLALQAIKSEPHEIEIHPEPVEDSLGSSNERDSGISFSSSSSCSDGYTRSSDPRSTSPNNYLVNETNSSNYNSNYQLHNRQNYPHQYDQHQSQLQQDSDEGVTNNNNSSQFRSELERLATEVATLNYMLVRRSRSDGDSDGSR